MVQGEEMDEGDLLKEVFILYIVFSIFCEMDAFEYLLYWDSTEI